MTHYYKLDLKISIWLPFYDVGLSLATPMNTQGNGEISGMLSMANILVLCELPSSLVRSPDKRVFAIGRIPLLE